MRKRSKYRPKHIRVDAHMYAVESMKKISQVDDALIVLKAKNHAAMDEIVQGRGTRDHVDVLIAAMNMAEAYAIHGKGNDWRDEIKAAQDAIYSMGKRGLEKDRFLFTGPELQAVNLGMDIHDAQLDESLVKEMEMMIAYVQKQIILKRARPIVKKELESI